MLIPRNALKAVSLAMAVNDARQYLNGMLVECNGQTVRLVASDGSRLHLMDVPRPVPAEGEPPLPPLADPVIVPRSLIDWALKNSKRGQTVELTVCPAPVLPRPLAAMPVIVVTCNGASKAGQAIDGQFPDYWRMIPHTLSGEVAQFNPAYVSDAYVAVLELADVRKGVTYAAELKHNGMSCALMVYGRFAALIMPWRTDEADIDPGLLAPLPGVSP